MNIKRKVKNIIKKMFLNQDEAPAKVNIPLPVQKKIRILLLTNRDSDNVGDQVIEASDIGLIKAVMENLNISSDAYEINSRAAAIVTQKYMETKDPKLLATAREQIEKCDVLIFGGAPVFNYLYQTFYERTAITLELAEEFNKPVLFSAVGVERYDEDNEKCQRLKKALNMNCVKQITTRDDYAVLEKYIVNEDIISGKVSDPAVFSSEIFRKYRTVRKTQERKKIGIFILRANGFTDNRIDFSRDDAAVFWKDLVTELDARGYNYELLTSGHFGDEAFLDYMIRSYNISEKKCIFNMNDPEKLIRKISSYDAVITCRLHPSIISFSLDVPSLGIVWNSKVRNFYRSIGYEERIMEVEDLNPVNVIERLEKAMEEGVKKDETFMMSVYNTLFYSLKKILLPTDSTLLPYSYEELKEKIPVYAGTSKKEMDKKLERKFRRAYKTYNERYEKNMLAKEEIIKLNEENKELKKKIKKIRQEKKSKTEQTFS